jgi:uncharacterized protein (TIRG00374 family)
MSELDTGEPSGIAEQRPRWRAVAKHLAKLGIGLAIVTFLLINYDARSVGKAIASADPLLLLWAGGFALLALACFAFGYRFALRPLRMPLRTFQIYKILLQVQFYALFLPGGANAVVKWYKLSRPGKQPAQSLALVTFTRAVRVFTLLLLVIAGMWLDSGFKWPVLRWLALGLLAATTVFLLLCMSSRMVDGFRTLVKRPWLWVPLPEGIRQRLEKILRMLTAFAELRPAEVAGVLATTMAGNVLEALMHVLALHAVGIEVSFNTMAWARGILVVCAMVPISLAGLGLRELSMIAILSAYGYAAEDVLAYSLLIFGVLIVGKGLIGGVLELWDWSRRGEALRMTLRGDPEQALVRRAGFE